MTRIYHPSPNCPCPGCQRHYHRVRVTPDMVAFCRRYGLDVMTLARNCHAEEQRLLYGDSTKLPPKGILNARPEPEDPPC